MGRRENYENINNSTFGISLPAFPIGKERPVPDSCANPDAPTFRTNLKINLLKQVFPKYTFLFTLGVVFL